MRVLIEKPRRTIKQRHAARKTFISFWVHWLAEYAGKFVKYKFIKFARLTGSDLKEVVKIILKFLFLTQGQALRKNQTALPHKKHWRK